MLAEDVKVAENLVAPMATEATIRVGMENDMLLHKPDVVEAYMTEIYLIIDINLKRIFMNCHSFMRNSMKSAQQKN